MLRPTVVITRPQPEADAWAAAVQRLGWPVVSLPLLCLQAPAQEVQRVALQTVWRELAQHHALMFVSAAAVRYFFEARPVDWIKPPVLPRSWAPGPATAEALKCAWADAGVDTAVVDAPAADALQFDSEALWTQVAPQVRPGFSLVLVRGSSDAGLPRVDAQDVSPWVGSGRDWLAQCCVERGARVQAVVAYERRWPNWSEATQRARLREALLAPVWHLSNRESLSALGDVPAAQWVNKAAFVTHPRIGEAAAALGFGRVHVCAPGVQALVAALESLSS